MDNVDESTHEAPQETMNATGVQAAMPQGGYQPHPLFPRDDGKPEERDIQFVTFRRRCSDGRLDNCPEDIPAGEITSWADVLGRWGGGEYKAIGKDKERRIVAWYPTQHGVWKQLDAESKPFVIGAAAARSTAEMKLYMQELARLTPGEIERSLVLRNLPKLTPELAHAIAEWIGALPAEEQLLRCGLLAFLLLPLPTREGENAATQRPACKGESVAPQPARPARPAHSKRRRQKRRR